MQSRDVKDKEIEVSSDSKQEGGNGQGLSSLNDVTRDMQAFSNQTDSGDDMAYAKFASSVSRNLDEVSKEGPSTLPGSEENVASSTDTSVASSDSVGPERQRKRQRTVRFDLIVKTIEPEVRQYKYREPAFIENGDSIEKREGTTLMHDVVGTVEGTKLLKTQDDFNAVKRGGLIGALDLAVADREKQKSESELIDALNLEKVKVGKKGTQLIRGDRRNSTYHTEEYKKRMKPKPGEETSAHIGKAGEYKEKVKTYKFSDAEGGRLIGALDLAGIDRERPESVEAKSIKLNDARPIEVLDLAGVDRERLQRADAWFNNEVDRITWEIVGAGKMELDVAAIMKKALKKGLPEIKHKESVIERFKSSFNDTINALKNFSKFLMTDIKKGMDYDWRKTREGLENLVNESIEKLQDMGRQMGDTWSRFADWAVEIARKMNVIGRLAEQSKRVNELEIELIMAHSRINDLEIESRPENSEVRSLKNELKVMHKKVENMTITLEQTLRTVEDTVGIIHTTHNLFTERVKMMNEQIQK